MPKRNDNRLGSQDWWDPLNPRRSQPNGDRLKSTAIAISQSVDDFWVESRYSKRPVSESAFWVPQGARPNAGLSNLIRPHHLKELLVFPRVPATPGITVLMVFITSYTKIAPLDALPWHDKTTLVTYEVLVHEIRIFSLYIFKRRAQFIGNFTNICKSLACHVQRFNCFNLVENYV